MPEAKALKDNLGSIENMIKIKRKYDLSCKNLAGVIIGTLVVPFLGYAYTRRWLACVIYHATWFSFAISLTPHAAPNAHQEADQFFFQMLVFGAIVASTENAVAVYAAKEAISEQRVAPQNEVRSNGVNSDLIEHLVIETNKKKSQDQFNLSQKRVSYTVILGLFFPPISFLYTRRFQALGVYLAIRIVGLGLLGPQIGFIAGIPIDLIACFENYHSVEKAKIGLEKRSLQSTENSEVGATSA